MTQQLSAAEAFEGMIKKIKANGESITFKIESDSGGEFTAEFEFDNVYKKHKIEHYRYPSTDAANTALSKKSESTGPSDPSTKRRNTNPRIKTRRSPSSYLKSHPSTTIRLTPPLTKPRTNLKTKTTPLRIPLPVARSWPRKPSQFASSTLWEPRSESQRRQASSRRELNQNGLNKCIQVVEKNADSLYVADKAKKRLPKPFRAWELIQCLSLRKRKKRRRKRRRRKQLKRRRKKSRT